MDDQIKLRERADHETGHYLVATELGLGHVQWLTLEPRRGTGGSIGLVRNASSDPSHFVRYQLGGICGTLVGRLGGLLHGADAITDSFVKELYISGIDDLAKVDLDTFLMHFHPTLDLVGEKWDRYKCISDALVERKTLYGGEASIVWMAHDDESLSDILEIYRAQRLPATPPAEWLLGTVDGSPAGPWFEDFFSWLRR